MNNTYFEEQANKTEHVAETQSPEDSFDLQRTWQSEISKWEGELQGNPEDSRRQEIEGFLTKYRSKLEETNGQIEARLADMDPDERVKFETRQRGYNQAIAHLDEQLSNFQGTHAEKMKLHQEKDALVKARAEFEAGLSK